MHPLRFGDKSVDLSEVMSAGQISSIAFEATVQVRNKVVDACKTIMKLSAIRTCIVATDQNGDLLINNEGAAALDEQGQKSSAPISTIS